MELAEDTCWNCQKPVGVEHFCNWCGKILPHRPGIDYFAFLGLKRKLNLDLVDLEKRFYALSRKLHPDNFYRANEKEKELSLDKAALLNDAYRTLKDPLRRGEYLLSLEGQRVDVNARQAPPELLEEVFELNEWLAELKMAAQGEGQNGHLADVREQLEKAKANFAQRAETFRDDVQALFERWDQALEAGKPEAYRKELLDQLSTTLAKRNYLRNLVRDVSTALEGQDTAPGSLEDRL